MPQNRNGEWIASCRCNAAAKGNGDYAFSFAHRSGPYLALSEALNERLGRAAYSRHNLECQQDSVEPIVFTNAQAPELRPQKSK
jgi:hypothetical protein